MSPITIGQLSKRLPRPIIKIILFWNERLVKAGISVEQIPDMNIRLVLLTAAKLERTGMCVHGEILQLHGTFR